MDIISKHTIKQQILDITIPNADDHEEVTTALSEVYKKNIDGMLEDICDGLIPPNEVVRIDSLTIDLGHLQFEHLATDFPKAVKTAVRELLFKKIRDNKVSPVRSAKAAGQNRGKSLLFYLATGQLPWYFEGDFHKLKREFSTKKVISTAALFGTLKNPGSRKRAVQFFEEKVLVALLLEELPMEKRTLVRQLHVLRSCLGKLGTISNAADTTTVSKTAKALLRSLKPKMEVYGIIMQQCILQLVGGPTKTAKTLSEVLPMSYHQKLQSLLHAVEWKKGSAFSEEEIALLKTLDTTFHTKSQEVTTVEMAEKKFEVDKKLDVDGGIAIKNAGLILVWPYLEAFFTSFSLMQEQSFIDDNAFTKAIHLLHYMVFKTEEGNETEWLLNKIMCGMASTDFVSENFDLDPAEKEECEHLLSALISNWPALKNTGPDSLRQTFLQRDGLLVPYENGWILKVERKAFDVLLDRLTWAISVVKMPWNEYLINTEW